MMTEQFYRIVTPRLTHEVTTLQKAADLFREYIRDYPNDYVEVWDIGDKKMNWSLKLWSFEPPRS
jgi:hypothetical protein